MERALYDPTLGYYCGNLANVGRNGDFITSVSCGDLFGSLLCEQFLAWSNSSDGENTSKLTWIEAGSHDGQLAKDILNYCRDIHPEQYRKLDYQIIEPSESRMEAQRKLLLDHLPRVQWRQSWSEVPSKSVDGIIFSNELLDAFPVERISWDAKQRTWFVWAVGLEQEQLSWVRMPAPLPAHVQVFSDSLPPELLAHLPDGFTTEIGKAACEWWREAANRLNSGRMLAIDYGLSQEEFFAPHRHEGTLRAYSQHRQSSHLLEDPGEQDLTSHVNFSAIKRTGHDAGLTTTSLESQETFLTRILTRLIERPQDTQFLNPKRRRNLQSLIHPSHFGRAFSVLVQNR